MSKAVENHLIKLEQQQEANQPEDSGLILQPIMNDSAFDSSKLNIKITDFGVGMY